MHIIIMLLWREREIQDVTKGGRTLLLHAKRHWPQEVGTILWSFALKAAEDCCNHLKRDENGHAPINKFLRMYFPVDIKSWHTPSFHFRCTFHFRYTCSECHASSAALGFNPKTLHVSPQYHVIFDDKFSTVPFMKNGEISPHWEELVCNISESVTDKTIDFVDTWAAETSENEGKQIDPNLVLTRSFKWDTYNNILSGTPSKKIFTFKEPEIESSSISVMQPSPSDGDTNLAPVDIVEGKDMDAQKSSVFMPTMGNIDSMILRCSSQAPKPSTIMLQNERQQKEAIAAKHKKDSVKKFHKFIHHDGHGLCLGFGKHVPWP